jgi:hypothetical protein
MINLSGISTPQSINPHIQKNNNMKLIELYPHFYKVVIKREMGSFLKPGVDPLNWNHTEEECEEREHDAVYYYDTDNFSEAQGIKFIIPPAYIRYVNEHTILNLDELECLSHVHILFKDKNIPPQAISSNSEHLWEVTGTSMNDLTLSPSILCKYNKDYPPWHGWIRNGEVIEA